MRLYLPVAGWNEIFRIPLKQVESGNNQIINEIGVNCLEENAFGE